MTGIYHLEVEAMVLNGALLLDSGMTTGVLIRPYHLEVNQVIIHQVCLNGKEIGDP